MSMASHPRVGEHEVGIATHRLVAGYLNANCCVRMSVDAEIPTIRLRGRRVGEWE